MRDHRVVIIGAGLGGLVAAMLLAHRGCAVTLVETAPAPGGKMREVLVDGARIDAGPTVLTMRWVFEEIFADVGTSLDAHLTLRRAETLARHAWSASERLDLFADIARSADAIGDFAGAQEAAGYRAFTQRSRKMFETLDKPFIRSQRPRLDQLVSSFGLFGLKDLSRISPFTTLWKALGEHFRDPRLLQLFGRYATYCGSSPFLAPATLMLVAHVEQDGVWFVEGGMHRLARSLAALAAAKGATLRFGTAVREITVAQGRASGVVLADGTRIAADAVIANADAAALTAGLFGQGVAQAAPRIAPKDRSLSAVTFALHAKTHGYPLERHNVFFSDDYKAEFDAIFRRNAIPSDPTVYICAQDRGTGAEPTGTERLLCLINAPAAGDARSFSQAELARCETRMSALLARCGLTIERDTAQVITDPAAFNQLFPATGGALYGPASHGWQASFHRAGSRSKVPGLYLAGGSVHPGPGVPMAAMSGRLAAAAVLADRASTARSRPAAMPGGMSMR
ncbi:1-hydroxycarotenoid 3,4-desaturase CrtD [Beijerinckia sp. L45]|uniref:1-hydroxycarotenoid 3,4-desaturase CrtD n=1 Tax=Beijerinckia sp. L45 TaxID=1641855 RepID=UPI00131B171D|nr:1-hydroxycarotenoid 3,4-desaturase CrtD [Beijerinckia sp. L45]